ncbi:MAG TPA: choice-of-anchor Q domain-containing protein, partial [Gammaproteobacteria bacterium]|nr:choice-of-anchor Q domain-containing protein [Gammaproteobacteria bacterium]
MKTFNSNTCRILFATCLGALCLIALTTEAATITVTNTNDIGAGSLRQAIADASDGDTIDFDPSLGGQTITLTSGELLVNKSVTINGPGPNNLTVDGNHASRVFRVIGGVTATIGGLSITNGYVSGSFQNRDGGGIYNDHSTLTVINCTISGNSASDSLGQGGGICNAGYLTGYFGYGSATLEVINCTVSDNVADLEGGGIFNNGQSGSATLTVTGSSVSGNTVTGGYGGGIATDGNGGSSMVEVVNSTLSDNSVRSFGGGILNSSAYGGTAALNILNSTISNNWGGDYGGGIYNVASVGGNSPLEVRHSTLSGNSCVWLDGGGIANLSGATSQVGSTIFNGNRISNGGTTTSLGYNLSSDDGSGFLTAIGDQINTNPLLGPLQDNGGATLTHAPLQGSPTIDAGDPNFTPPPDYD